MPRRCDNSRLLIRWDRLTKDIRVFYPNEDDGRLVFNAMFAVPPGAKHSLVAELDRRGYDPKTLRFEIRRKTEPPDAGELETDTPSSGNDA